MKSGPLKDILAPSRTYQHIDQDALRAAIQLLARGPFNMGVRMFSCFTSTFIGPLPANATDTLAMTTPGVSQAVDNGQVVLLGFAGITAGAGTTAIVLRLRRGALVTSPVFTGGAWTQTVPAGNGHLMPILYQDAPGVVAGQQYSLSVAQTGATGAGTWQDGCLMAVVL